SVRDRDGKLYCTNMAPASLHSSPRFASAITNHLRTPLSWFTCWGTGDLHAGGTTTWYYTVGDENESWGWVPGADVRTPPGFDADPSAHGLRSCGDMAAPQSPR